MAFSRPASQRELDYIRANWQTMKIADIASELGRGERFVYKKINDMHLRDGQGASPGPPIQDGAGRAEVVQVRRRRGRGSLEDLADVVWAAVLEAEPGQLPKLSAEYREILSGLKSEEADAVAPGERPVSDIIRLARGG